MVPSAKTNRGNQDISTQNEDVKDSKKKRNKRLTAFEKERILKEKTLPPSKAVKAITGKQLKDSSLFWCLLALARIYLSVAQTGYIHPDEFHQSLQVNAYDILQIDGAKPWEFTTGSPIRSVMFSGLVSVPYIFLKLISPYMKMVFDIEVITPRSLLISPRIFMTSLSFIADFCIFRIASCCYVRPWQCVEVFAGSYIMLVYGSRTFSNSIELILFALLLWRVCLSMVDSTKTIRLENMLKDLYETAESMKEKVRIARTKNHLASYNFSESFFISVIVTYGFFVRPTFIVFAFIPVAYWLQRGVVTKEIDFMYFNLRCLSLVPGIVLTFITCILIDSFYYSSLTLSELVYWNVTANSFTVTPINFILYNSKQINLADHGFHPYLLHIAVNIPILHGILGFCGLWSVSRYFASFVFHRLTSKPKIYSIASMLLGSFIFPVFALSLIPHQEPRFLLPTLLPLVLLHSNTISLYAVQKFKFTRHFCFLMWQVWNILCVVFFGFLHQGGVTRSLIYVHDYVASQPPTNEYKVFFSHMYTPPTFLLMRKIPVVGVTEDGHRYRVQRTLTVHDLGSSMNVEELFDTLDSSKQNKSSAQPHILLCISASLSLELHHSLPSNMTLERLVRLPGHLSTEYMPPFHLNDYYSNEQCNSSCQIAHRVREFSVDIYNVKFFNSSHFVDKEIPIQKDIKNINQSEIMNIYKNNNVNGSSSHLEL